MISRRSAHAQKSAASCRHQAGLGTYRYSTGTAPARVSQERTSKSQPRTREDLGGLSGLGLASSSKTSDAMYRGESGHTRDARETQDRSVLFCFVLSRGFVPAPPGVFEPVGIPTIEPVPFRLALHARCAGFLDLDVLRSLGLFHASSRRGRSSARPSSFASRASSLGVPAAPPAANGRYASARACLLPSSRLTDCEQARGGALGVGGRHEVRLRLGSSTS